MSDQPMPTEKYEHVADGASTADGRAITWALLVVADEIRRANESTTSHVQRSGRAARR